MKSHVIVFTTTADSAAWWKTVTVFPDKHEDKSNKYSSRWISLICKLLLWPSFGDCWEASSRRACCALPTYRIGHYGRLSNASGWAEDRRFISHILAEAIGIAVECANCFKEANEFDKKVQKSKPKRQWASRRSNESFDIWLWHSPLTTDAFLACTDYISCDSFEICMIDRNHLSFNSVHRRIVATISSLW